MHKLHGWMCTVSSWCTHSKFTASKRAPEVLTKATSPKNLQCHLMSNAILVSGYLAITHSIVECSHVKSMLSLRETLE